MFYFHLFNYKKKKKKLNIKGMGKLKCGQRGETITTLFES